MLKLLSLLFLVGQAVGDKAANDAVDEVIARLDQALGGAGLNSIPIAEVFYHWKYHHLPGTMHCYKGSAGSLVSLLRVADVQVTRAGSTTVLRVPLKLGSLAYGYETCDLKVVHLVNWKGHVKASVESNSLEAQVTLTRNGGSCTTVLNSINFTSVGKVVITTGGGIAHHLESSVAKPISEQINKDVVGRINSKLNAIAPLVFSSSDLCSKIQ